MIARITVPLDLLRELVRYDPATGNLYWLPREPRHFSAPTAARAAALCSLWNARYAGREALSQPHTTGYKHGLLLGRSFKSHRIIYALQTGEWPFEIDHDNGDRSDNRWTNLKPKASRREQMKNQAMRSDNTSGVLGVRRDRNRWRVQIASEYIGTYPTIEEAAAARRAAEARLGYHPQHGRR